MKKTAAILVFLLLFQLSPSAAIAATEVTTFEEPDVNRAYCGKQIPYAFCLCAFQNQGCEVMGISQEEGADMIENGFREWVGSQIKEVAKSCIDGGGHWNAPTRQCIVCTDGEVRSGNKCVAPDKVREDAGAAFCAPMKDFADDWRAFSDFNSAASETDTSDEVRLYYETREKLIPELIKRQSALYDQTVATVLLSHLEAYTAALAQDDAVLISEQLSSFAWFVLITPEEQRDIFAVLFETEDEDLLKVYETLQGSIPTEAKMPPFDEAKVEGRLPDVLWGTVYEQVLEFGSGVAKANQKFTEKPESYLVAIDEEIINQLRTEHVESLRLDKVKAELMAHRAQSRWSAVSRLPVIASLYNQMESFKEKEFERARDQITSSCNQ